MRDEILEQAGIVERLTSDPTPFVEAAAAARKADVRFVLYCARGTSDNAAVYGKYLATINAGLPAGLAIPSAATLYRKPSDFRRCLVFAISQSGETPDVAEYLTRAREAGAFTIAVTNDDSSVLAGRAHCVLATGAGPERAVAATKTYTSQLTALAQFWSTWCGDRELLGALRRVPAAMHAALGLEEEVADVARWLRFSERLLVAARGYNFATALETALKLKETSYIAAMPYSAADLMHGPIAVVEHGYPALAFVLPGATHAAMLTLVQDLAAREAELIVVEGTAAGAGGADRARRRSDAAGAAGAPRADGARSRWLSFACELPEPLSPLAAIVPGQLLALHLAIARGNDPDRPRGLHKVTRTL